MAESARDAIQAFRRSHDEAAGQVAGFGPDRRLPMFAGFSSKPIGKTGFVAIQTSEPARSYLLELTNDGASLTEAEGPQPTPGRPCGSRPRRSSG
jgi:hypothetical protein